MKKVLVCDDDDGILEVISIILQEQQYDVQTSVNGKAIIKKVKAFCPDVILLDIWMPGIDGREVTKLLKREPQTAGIPIIVISALNDTEKIAKDCGADDFMTKPFDMDDLLEKVHVHANAPVNAPFATHI